MTRYIIRYRCVAPSGQTTLIVEDDQGAAHVFSNGRLHAQIASADASTQLVQLLTGSSACMPVPRVSPYTLDGLRHLTAAPRQYEQARGGR
jgi:hypothetical protein